MYTHMSCDGFFPMGHKEFGSLLITDNTLLAKTKPARRKGEPPDPAL
jgi:hypothetical protein